MPRLPGSPSGKLPCQLNDEDVNSNIPWALGEIAHRRAIGPLIEQMERDDPSARVAAISALETLQTRDALPRLRTLLQDTRRSNIGGQVSVADAARRAIAVISQGC